MNKKFWFIILISLLIAGITLGVASAEELITFDNVKQYDEITKTVTIVNFINLGRDISKIKLNTPLVYSVPIGYEKVWEHKIELFDDTYTDAIGEVTLIDMNNGKVIERQLDYKLLTYEEVWIDTYNETEGHYETKEKWIDFDSSKLYKGNYTIGVFTTTERGDYIEWIPTLFGKEINEWATWITEGHGVAFVNNNANTAEMGTLILIGTSDILISQVSKDSQCNNKVNINLKWTNDTLIKQQAFSGDTATFPTPITLRANTNYTLAVDGGSPAYYIPQAGNFPVVETDFTWAPLQYGGWYSGSTNDNIWCVASINYSVAVAPDSPPQVTLNTPIDTANITTSSINFGGVASDDINLINVSLIIDDVYTNTNSSGINNSNYTFLEVLSDGNYTWNYEACDNSSQCTNGTPRTFSVDTGVLIVLANPIDNAESTISNIAFNGTVTTPMTNIINVSLIINGIVNKTNSSGIEGNYTFLETFEQQVLNWTFEACNPSGCQLAANRSLEIHLTPTTVSIITPTGVEDYILLGSNETFTWNITEPGTNLSEHIVECLYTYNETTYNVTDICVTTNSTTFPYEDGVNFLNFTVTEEFGFITRINTTWSYKVKEVDQTFNNETTEGNLEEFEADIILGSGLSISGAALIYNGTTNIGSSSTIGNITTLIASNVLIPGVNETTNFSFYWTIVLSDATLLNLSTQNQTAFNLSFDNCSVFTNRIFNFTSYDEEIQNVLTNTTKEIAINVYSADRSQVIFNISDEYDTNPTPICLNRNLTSAASYSLDAIIRYEAIGYSNEYYNIVDLELTNDTSEQKISLYSLNISDSTEFQLTFTGQDFLPVEDALVFVERQYISENIFKTVELPKTDSNGQTVLHLVRNEVVYNIVVTKDGELLGSFSNLIAFCDDFSIGDCKITLNAIGEESAAVVYDDLINILYDAPPTYNDTTNIVSFSFTATDGESKTIVLDVERRDVFENTTVCTNTLVSTSGTVFCNVGNITDSSLVSSISIDGETLLVNSVQIDSEGYGSIGAVFLFIISIVLIFVFGDSKNGVILSVSLGYIAAVVLGVIAGGIIGIGSAGIMVIGLTILAIYQLNKKKPI